jgi:hypothetical protein
MTAAIGRLDDNIVNTAPDVAGANTPFGLVTHALGACGWWTGHLVCGHPSDRDRAAEFLASGSVSELLDAIATSKARLRELSQEIGAATSLAIEPRTQTPLGADWTVGAALVHAYEELAQHLGHLEITVDILLPHN